MGWGTSQRSSRDHEPACLPPAPTSRPPLRGENAAGASCPSGLVKHQRGMEILSPGLAFLVFSHEIKFLGSKFTFPKEVLLVSGEVLSARGHTGFAKHNGEETSAGEQLSSHAAAGHPWQPGFPFSACLVVAQRRSRAQPGCLTGAPTRRCPFVLDKLPSCKDF